MYPYYQPVPAPMSRTTTNQTIQSVNMTPLPPPVTQIPANPAVASTSQPVLPPYANATTTTMYQPVAVTQIGQPILQTYPSSIIQTTVPPIKEPEGPWKKKYPCLISFLFVTFQAITSLVIIGCEIGSMLIDIVTATIYVGLWAGIFFLLAWISASVSSRLQISSNHRSCFSLVCCSRDHGCAVYNLVNQCIALVFAVCVIVFDSYFIIYPQACFYTKEACQGTGSSRGVYYSTSNFDNIKIPLIKGQLAAGCVMLVLCLIEIFLYALTFFRVNRGRMAASVHPPNDPSLPYSKLPNGNSNQTQQTMVQPNSVPHSSTEISCPGCNSKMVMGTHRQATSYPLV